jgi:regulator of replication initiation timing
MESRFNSLDYTVLHPNFYKIDRDTLLRLRPLKERLSSSEIRYDYYSDDNIEEFAVKAAQYLTRFAYGMFRFISEEKNYSIHFDVTSETSSCSLTENHIQVSISNLLKMHLPMQLRVDTCAADVIHELYHKLFTVKDIARICKIPIADYYRYNFRKKEFFEQMLPTPLHNIVSNILEDRRIEELGSRKFPGLSFFLEEFRKYAYYIHYDHVFYPDDCHSIIIQHLMLRVLLPESLPRLHNSIAALKQDLQRVVTDNTLAEVGIKKARETLTNDLPIVEEVIGKIDEYINTHKELVYSDNYNDILTATHDIIKLLPDNVFDALNAASDEKRIVYINIAQNLEPTSSSVSKDLTKKLDNTISEQLKELESESSNVKKEKVEKIPRSDAFKHINELVMIEEPKLPIDTLLLDHAREMSKAVFNNLGFLDARFQRTEELYELTEGDIDETQIHMISFDKHIFESDDAIPSHTMDFCILLDESGSMGQLINEACTAVLALMLALKDSKHINLFVYGHTFNDNDTSKNKNAVLVLKYYNTIEGYTDWETIFSARSRGSNADGFAIQKMGEILSKTSSKEKVLVVVSDGQPRATRYGGAPAEQHVRSVVDKLKQEGVTTIQLCMAHIENSPKMFEHYIPYDSTGNFFEKLKDILITKLVTFSQF